MTAPAYTPSKELIAARDTFIYLVNTEIKKKTHIAQPSKEELKSSALPPPLNRFEAIKRRYHADQLDYEEKVKKERIRCEVEQSHVNALKAAQARLLEIEGHIEDAERLAAKAGGKEVDAAKQRFKKALADEREKLKAFESDLIKKGYANLNRIYPNFPHKGHENAAIQQYHCAMERERLQGFSLSIDTEPVRDYLTTLLCLSKEDRYSGRTLKDDFCKKIGEAVFSSMFGNLELNSGCQVLDAKFAREGLEKIQHKDDLKIMEFLQSPEELAVLDEAA